MELSGLSEMDIVNEIRKKLEITSTDLENNNLPDLKIKSMRIPARIQARRGDKLIEMEDKGSKEIVLDAAYRLSYHEHWKGKMLD